MTAYTAFYVLRSNEERLHVLGQGHSHSLVHNDTSEKRDEPSTLSWSAKELPSIMFLLSIFLGLLLKYHGGDALPVRSTPNVTASPEESAILALIVSTNTKPQPTRTLFGVAWSCILTVFICAWTSVHPNVPPQSRMGGLFARVKLMFWTVVAPELVLAWAVRQWFAAKEIRDIYNERKGRKHSPRDNVNAEENFSMEMLDEGTWSFPDHGWLPTCEQGFQEV